MTKPLAIDLFCGLGGFSAGALAEGYDCIGFDIEQHVYGEHRYPAQLVVQDVLTLHGAQFRDAALIVASPPCQAYSWMAMPWSRAKAKAAAIRADETGAELEKLNRLFNACFRIQREACEAAGRHIPMVVENVRGAIPWVGRARWSFGSFYLWGDVPALMPAPLKHAKVPMPPGYDSMTIGFQQMEKLQMFGGTVRDATKVPGFRFDGSGQSFQSASVAETGIKAPGMNWSDRTKRGQDFTRIAGNHAVAEGVKGGGGWFGSGQDCSLQRRQGSKSPARKAASAMIAKIPEPLSRHIAKVYHPGHAETAA